MKRHLAPALTLLVAGTAHAADPPADPPQFVKGPFLQELSGSSVVVKWETSRGSVASVVLEGPDRFKKEVKTADPTPFHAVQITGLKASTTYAYRVLAEGATSETGHFTTAPPETEKAFSFLVYGDSRSDHAAHERVVRAMQRKPAAFLVNTGDMVQEGASERDWELFFKVESPMLRDRCVFACVGNHELISDGTPIWVKYFHPGLDRDPGKRGLFHTMRWGNARFVFLNTVVPWETLPDKAWLEGVLDDAQKEPGLDHLFVVQHHGLWSSGPHGKNADMERAGLARMLEKAKATVVFAGHDHLYERGEKAGVRYLVTGGAGAPLYPANKVPDGATLAIEPTHHFLEVTVEGPKASIVAWRADGSVLERCNVGRGAGWDCPVALPRPVAPPVSTGPSTSGGGDKKKNCDCSAVRGGPDAGWTWLVGACGAWAWRRRRGRAAARRTTSPPRTR